MNTVICPNGHEIDQEKIKETIFKKTRRFYYYGCQAVPVLCSECATILVVKEKYEIFKSAVKKLATGTEMQSLSKEEQVSLDDYFLGEDCVLACVELNRQWEKVE